MACPCFRPRRPLPPSMWPGPLRPPLGEVQQGFCAAADLPYQPTTSCLIDLCNLGYARKTCDHFPSDEATDAVRFSVAGDCEGSVSIAYATERDHLPGPHGMLIYHRKTARWEGFDDSSPAAELAQAYLDSYLRWKETT